MAALLTVGDAPELRAAVLAFRSANRDIVNAVNRETRATLNPVWRGIVAANATSHMDSRVLDRGVKIRAGNPPAFIAADSRRALSGGLVPSNQWQAFEFGTLNRGRKRTYTSRSPLGRSHTVTRATSNQLPRRAKGGRVVYPAMAETLPRAVALWVQMIVRAYSRAAEGEAV